MASKSPLIVLMLAITVVAAHAAGAAEEPQDGLGSAALARAGRTPPPHDPVQAAVVDGTFAAPAAGDVVAGLDGSVHTWRRVAASPEGTFADVKGGSYVCVTAVSDARRVVLLEARGHGM